jgi:hypothetical protein
MEYTAPARRWRAFVADGLLVLLLLGLALKLTYNISSVRDLGLCDEATYILLSSMIPEHGLPQAEGCPLYALWYLGVAQLQPDRVPLYYLSWSLLVALLAAGFYLLVRSLGGGRFAALLAAFLLLTSSLVDIHPYPSHLATLILVLGGALAVRLRSLPLALALLGVTLLGAGYARPEYFVAFLVFCAAGLPCSLVALWRCPRCWPVLGASALVVLLPALLLARAAGLPLGGGRSFYAFGQHYATNVSAHRPPTGSAWCVRTSATPTPSAKRCGPTRGRSSGMSASMSAPCLSPCRWSPRSISTSRRSWAG